MRRFVTLAVATALLVGCPGGPPHRARRNPAPALDLEEVLTGPPPAELASALRGHPVVLELWATWCGPCVAAIPRWNHLVEAFHGTPVRFLAVSSEDAATVRRLLAKHPMQGWVGLDRDESVFRALNVQGIPHTVLIDAKGRIAGQCHPEQLTETTVRALLDGRDLGLPRQAANGESGQGASREGDENADLVVRVVPSTSKVPYQLQRGSEIRASGMGAEELIANVWHEGLTRIRLDGDLPDGRFDLVFSAPHASGEAAEALLRDAVAAALGVTVRRERVVVDVYLLRRRKDAPALQEAVGPRSYSAGRGLLTFSGGTSMQLANALEYSLDTPVVDETGLKGRFDLELRWKGGNDDDLIRAVKALGFELVPESREIEVLVVRPAPAPTPKAGT